MSTKGPLKHKQLKEIMKTIQDMQMEFNEEIESLKQIQNKLKLKETWGDKYLMWRCQQWIESSGRENTRSWKQGRGSGSHSLRKVYSGQETLELQVVMWHSCAQYSMLILTWMHSRDTYK